MQALPLLFGAATLGLSGAKFMGLDKKAQQAISGGGGKQKYQPTWVGRQYNGFMWVCPDNTIETGDPDNNKACMNSQFHPPAWRYDGKQWGHSCPWGTTPTNESEWEKKCEVGHIGRQFFDGKWQCPPGTTDTGKTWDNAPWAEAHKQCKRSKPFTQRVMRDGKWVCPDGSKDTGKTWGQPNEWDQCHWIGP